MSQQSRSLQGQPPQRHRIGWFDGGAVLNPADLAALQSEDLPKLGLREAQRFAHRGKFGGGHSGRHFFFANSATNTVDDAPRDRAAFGLNLRHQTSGRAVGFELGFVSLIGGDIVAVGVEESPHAVNHHRPSFVNCLADAIDRVALLVLDHVARCFDHFRHSRCGFPRFHEFNIWDIMSHVNTYQQEKWGEI